ncbi:LysR family transcriptional regulator [Azospirillum sp. ST 5-10]|uniref:LysR family transcriptional regulator n=1 Tax=unclassified Azospirillum TaxID=2630922 RepID=UPI003F4A653D
MDPQRLGLVSTRLLYFQLVAEQGSVRRAALALNVAPSAVSRAVKHLEEDLGVPLLDRIGRRLKLTSAGETLLHHARASVQQLSSGLAFIQDLQGLRRGNVRVAAVESMMRETLPAVLSRFWGRFPNVSVDLRTTGSQEALDAVADGRIDLAIAFDVPVPRKAKRLASAKLGLGALVRPDHPLAGNGTVRLREFAGERVLLADTSLTLGRTIEQTAVAAGVRFEPRAITNSIGALIHFAVQGYGVTFQTRLGAERELSEGRLVFLALRERGLRPRELVLAARANGQLSEGPATLAHMLSKVVADLDEETS